MYQERRLFFLGLLFVITIFIFTGWSEQVQCQPKYPTRPITIVVSSSAGGSTDLTERIVTSFLSKKWGVPIIVNNDPGGGGIPAQLDVMQSAPDGYKLYAENTRTSLQMTDKKALPFNVMDRTFIGIMTLSPCSFSVNPKSPIKTIKDLEAEAKKNPEQFSWTGSGTSAWAARSWCKAIGIDVRKTKNVVGKGGVENCNLVAGGHAMLACGSLGTQASFIKGGLLRALAVGGSKRVLSFPDIPCMAELGYPKISAADWNGLSGPPGIPSYIVEIWENAMEEVLKDPVVISKLQSVPLEPFYMNGRDLKEFVRNQIEELIELWK